MMCSPLLPSGELTAFLLSINKLVFSKQHSSQYYLYRVYHYARKTHQADFYIVPGSLADSFTLDPIQFRVRQA